MAIFGEDFLANLGQNIDDVASQAASSISQDIGDFISNQAKQALVRVGAAPGGNLTAAQIAAGETGSSVGLRPSSQPASLLSRADANVKSMGLSPWLIGGVALVAGIFIFRR